MNWKSLDSEYILKPQWLTVRKDHVRMPTGTEIEDYYVLEYPDWINVIAITKEGLFVIERQYRHGTQSIDFELCAGTVERGESLLATVQRELLEETGYAGGGMGAVLHFCTKSCCDDKQELLLFSQRRLLYRREILGKNGRYRS